MDERLKKLLMMDYATKNPQGLFGNQNQGGLFGNFTGGGGSFPTELLVGSQIAGAGLKGENPFSSFTPALLNAAKIKKAFGATGYRQLSIAEKKAKNLPIDKQFQVNLADGKVSQIGGSAVDIDLNTNEVKPALNISSKYEAESKNFKLQNATKFGKIIPRLTKGTTLSKDQVENLEKTVTREFPSYLKEQKQRYKRYKKMMELGGFDDSIFLQDYTTDSTLDLSNMSDEELLRLLTQ